MAVGQVLTIPNDVESTGNDEDVTDNNLYVVQRGDSLFSIASKYGVNVNDIIMENNLNSDVITIGQVLTIPLKSTGMPSLYVVQKGDNLWSIANKYGVSINQIRMVNNLTSDVLNIGQTLIIP